MKLVKQHIIIQHYYTAKDNFNYQILKWHWWLILVTNIVAKLQNVFLVNNFQKIVILYFFKIVFLKNSLKITLFLQKKTLLSSDIFEKTPNLYDSKLKVNNSLLLPQLIFFYLISLFNNLYFYISIFKCFLNLKYNY